MIGGWPGKLIDEAILLLVLVVGGLSDACSTVADQWREARRLWRLR